MCCCHGRGDRRSAGKAWREARRAKRHQPSNLRRRLAWVRIVQTIIAVVFLFNCLLASGERRLARITAVATFVTLLITTLSLVFSIGGHQSIGFLIYGITADAVCIVLQMLTITTLFAQKFSDECFTGDSRPEGARCSVTWSSLVFSNVLLTLYIHTIVTASILIVALRHQGGRGLSDSIPDEDPPAYPDLEGDVPASLGGDALVLDGDAPVLDGDAPVLDGDRSDARKGGVGNTSVASSATLAGPGFTPQSASESDSDDGREDRPLLRV